MKQVTLFRLVRIILAAPVLMDTPYEWISLIS